MAALLLCCAILTCGMTAFAAENTLDVTYLPITQEGFVADTFNGVDAIYNRYGSTYYCTELITRYYAQVYGLTINASGSGPVVEGTSNYWFEIVTENPQPGDILFGTAAQRGSSYNHWALVKSYDADTGVMTLFEQNWRWNGQAGVNRQLAFPTSSYTCYRLCSSTGEVKTLHEKAIEASWASSSITAAETSGVFTYYGSYGDGATREQFSEMAVKLVINLTGEAIYQRELPLDESGNPDTSYCAQAYAMGILNGLSDGSLNPNGSLTRQEASVIMARAYALVSSLPVVEDDSLTQFTDSDNIAGWATEAVAQMAACSVLQGNTDGTFRPTNTLSVEAAITIAMRTDSSLRTQLERSAVMPDEIINASADAYNNTLAENGLVLTETDAEQSLIVAGA
jgi:hypothetical protein